MSESIDLMARPLVRSDINGRRSTDSLSRANPVILKGGRRGEKTSKPCSSKF
jgi:hypothetical protein